jgi:hypothetical protein
MIDLIKYFIVNKDKFIKTIEDSDKIDLRMSVNSKTAEISDKRIAHYKSMFIETTENRATLKGSIHKYFNMIKGNGNQNYNDFSYCDFKYALNHLQNTFELKNNNTNVTNLEFGINIETTQDPQELIDYYILMYDYKLPNRNEKFYGKGDYLEFKTTDYSLKIYNKSKQNSLKNRKILRVELKITGSRYLKRHFNIFTLKDLDRNRFKLLFNKLLEHFDKLLVVDDLVLKNHHRMDEMMLFKDGINPNYWKRLTNSKHREKFKKDFNKVLVNYNLLETKKYLNNLLEIKYSELMNCDFDKFEMVA